MVEKPLLLSPWYLNSTRIGVLSGRLLSSAAQLSILKNSRERVDAMNQTLVVANSVIRAGQVPNFLSLLQNEPLPEGRSLGSLWATFTFKGLNASLMAQQRGRAASSATIRTKFVLGDLIIDVAGRLIPDHVFSSSSVGYLSLTRKAFVFGEFEFQRDGVEVWPYIIGDFSQGFFDDSQTTNHTLQNSRVYPDQLDCFSKIRDVRSPNKHQISVMKGIPESHIKAAFCSIIGEPFIDRDWGGEHSDVYTSRMIVDGRSQAAAFLLKGPGTPGPMYPTSLGKRGDQLVRVFSEPADLVVIQHHSKIETSVIKTAEAFAVHPSNPRRYCIIDGADTWRILKAYGMFPT